MDQTSPERINEVVESLVEALSQMVPNMVKYWRHKVMTCIQGDIQDGLRDHCSQLINSTNQLITISKMTAVDDPTLLSAVTESIKETSASIGKFIDAFTHFARNREDQKMNILFSTASKALAGTYGEE